MVAPYLPRTHAGGKEYFVYYASKQLANMGHRVCILTSSHSLKGNSYIDDGVEVLEMPILHDFESYYTPLTLPCFPFNKGKPDIIHIHEPCAVLTTFASLFAKTFGIPLITSYYNDPLPFGPWKVPLGILSKLVDAAIAGYGMTFNRMKLKLADKVVILRREQVKSSRYLHGYEGKVKVLPMGISPHFFAQPASRYLKEREALLGVDDRRVVLYVGRLDFRKGVHILIQAMKSTEELNTKLVLIGSSPYEHVFKQMTGSLGINAVFVGGIPNEKLPAWYDAADLLALPSVHLEESFGSVILEAWSRKKPVIVSDLPGPSSVVRAAGGGLVVKKGDPKELANTIRLLLTSEELAQTMGLSGYGAAKNFSYERIGEQLVDVYEEALSGEKMVDIDRFH